MGEPRMPYRSGLVFKIHNYNDDPNHIAQAGTHDHTHAHTHKYNIRSTALATHKHMPASTCTHTAYAQTPTPTHTHTPVLGPHRDAPLPTSAMPLALPPPLSFAAADVAASLHCPFHALLQQPQPTQSATSAAPWVSAHTPAAWSLLQQPVCEV